ncbi:hypothetical protein C7B61_06210 [filamentous cyanobacterium CCP1]|nr:hypothetical protein C7B76_23790 [filamentous cyanobacterium CCP2]PSB67426.1 hypothetical protein C7B61_06210 [filamentous cyanobacterium CCP1]
MTIQRQYSLPNCKFILEGLTNDNPVDGMNARPRLSILTQVECHLSSVEKPLAGGRDFLENLVKAVSEYAQDYLSGIPHAARRDRQNDSDPVQLYRIDKNLHRLSLQPPITDDSKVGDFPPPMEIDLTTVQLFDLVEAVDQFYADAQTVPDLSLSLKPLPKRYVVSQEPMTKRAIPAVLGVSSLAVAAAAMFFLPAPEVRRPEQTPDPATQQESPASTNPDGSPNPPDAEAVTPSPAADPSPTANEGATSSEPADLDAIAASAANISDPAELETLTTNLQGSLYTAWAEKPEPTFEQPLEYRVGVDQNGQIVGYRFVNEPALTYLNEIPLSDVQFPTPEAGGVVPDSLAQFLVVFRPDEIIEVSPWYGLPPDASAPAGESQSEPAPNATVEPDGSSP